MSEKQQGERTFSFKGVRQLDLGYIPGKVTVDVITKQGNDERRARLAKVLDRAKHARTSVEEANASRHRASVIAAKLLPANGLKVRITGPEALVAQLDPYNSYGTVNLRGPVSSVDRGRVEIAVTVLERIAVSITDGMAGGEYCIGDTLGRLSVTLMSGACVVTAGAVGEADLILSGACQATLNSVNGELSVSAYDEAVAEVKAGYVKYLTVGANARSRVTFDGSAEDAGLFVVGADARIKVHTVLRTLRETFNAEDRIRVVHRP